MSKMYYIKTRTMEQAERMRDKLMFKLDIELLDAYKEKEITFEEYQEKEAILVSQIEELDEAMNNITSDKGCVNYKAEWKYIEIINKYANQRNILDMAI